MSKLPPLSAGQTVELGGVVVNYTSSVKDPNDLTLVLIHGFGASLETWHDVYSALGTKFSVVRLDLKGHGFSSKPKDGNYTLDEQAHLVVTFIAKLGLRRVVLVGHSLGGAVALLACLRHLDSVADFKILGLILIDSACYPQKYPFFVVAIRNPITRLLISLVPAELRAKLLLGRIFSVTSQVTPDRVHRYAYFFDLPGSRNALKETANNISPPNVDAIVARFKELSTPTLILWGQDDRVVPLGNAHRLHRDMKNSRLTILAETGHVPQEERPERALEEIREFVDKLE